MKSSSFLLALMTLFIFSCKDKPKTTSKNENATAVQKSMNTNASRFLKDESVTAISIGIFKDGNKYTSHYGEIDPNTGNTPNDSTLYEIASVTKTMTGALVAQAVLEGKLSLDDDIRTFLDEDYPNLEYNGTPIRIRDLLSHTSRLPSNNKGIAEIMQTINDSTAFKFNAIEMGYSQDDFFNYLHEIKLDTLPGHIYSYSNLGANLTGHILEQVNHKSYDNLLKDVLFDNLNMNNSKLKLTKLDSLNLAQGYNDKRTKMPFLPLGKNLWGAEGGVKSTVPDILNYIEFQLDSTNVLAQKSHEKVYTFSDAEYMAYFWPVENHPIHGIYYEHHGGAFGFNTFVYVYPKYNMGVVVTTNTSGAKASNVLDNVVLGLVDDLKPFGKKSITYAIEDSINTNVNDGVTYYKELKENKPEVYDFSDENSLNSLGYRVLRSGDTQGAIKIFTLNTEEFPESSNPFDSLGEAYLEEGNYQMALKNYKKALSLDPNATNAKEMITKIEALVNAS